MENNNLKPGEKIPEELILKRYKDKEFDGILIQIKGDNQSLLRATEDNRYLFKVDREVYPVKDLEVITDGPKESQPPEIDKRLPDYIRPYLKKAFILENDNETLVYDQDFMPLGRLITEESGDGRDKKLLENVTIPDNNITKLREGDALPAAWQQICSPEKEGFSLKIGQYLFRMDLGYSIVEKINLQEPNRKDLDEYEKTEQLIAPPKCLPEEVDPAEKTAVSLPLPLQKHNLNMTPKSIVTKIVNRFKKAIKSNKLQLDYFVEQKLSNEKYDDLAKVLLGDIKYLNEEIREGVAKNPERKIGGGLSLLKAALIHELYINTTLVGRVGKDNQGIESGRTLKALWTFLILLNHNSSLRQLGADISPAEQKEMIRFVGGLQDKYKDKGEIIKRIYKKLLFDLDEGILTFGNRSISVDKFKAILIYKFYENTNRMDRGDGITMICITRDIIDFRFKK